MGLVLGLGVGSGLATFFPAPLSLARPPFFGAPVRAAAARAAASALALAAAAACFGLGLRVRISVKA